jgi:hypothetical protein
MLLPADPLRDAVLPAVSPAVLPVVPVEPLSDTFVRMKPP